MPSPVKHVVIADDDMDDVDLFKEIIKEVCPHIKLSVAQDGVDLIRLLDLIDEPDFIILDINMPRKDGKQCLKEIRSKEKFKHVPILVLTTSDVQEDLDYCLQNGANQYRVKPRTYTAFTELVTGICRGWLPSPVSPCSL